MGVVLKYIGQSAMDGYLQNYRTASDFWTLQDFIMRAATVIAEFYQRSYDAQYQMNRQDKTDEVISFSADILSEQDLKVERKDGDLVSTLDYPVMSFIHDKQTSGVQQVIPLKPNDVSLERSNITEIWQLKLNPLTNRIFWVATRGKLSFYKKGFCNITLVKVLYVPAVMNESGEVNEDALIADGVAEMAINMTILKMKQEKDGIIIKELNDGNSNKALENELNLVKR